MALKKSFFVFIMLVLSLTATAQSASSDADSLSNSETADMFFGNAKRIDESQMNNKDQAANALEAIRGRVAGLQVEHNGANAMSAVRLRGTTSLAGGNDPLIIVDGVMGDLSLLSSIYPTDIESFAILKDASETSQFGSRGAAGVIAISTIRGKAGNMKVNYNGSFGLSTVYKTLDMLDATGYRQFAKQRGISIIDLGYDTDFQKAIEQTGVSQQHHVAFTGGTERSNYRVSLGYVKNETVIERKNSRTFLSNMNMTHKMFDDLLQVNIGMFGSTGREKNIFDQQKLFYSAAAWNPTFPSHKNQNDEWDGYASASQINNPLALLDERDHVENSHLSSHARLTFRFLPELSLTLFGAYSYDVDQHLQYLPTYVWNKGQAFRSTAKKENLMGDAAITFNKTVGAHAFGIMTLAEVHEDTYRGYSTTVTNFTTDILDYDNLSAGALRPWNGTTSYYEQPTMVSFMGRFKYTLFDRYTLVLTGRADGSSKFGDKNKWGYFPSLSGTWEVTKEAFMKGQHIFNLLKLSMGYGLTGNQSGIDSYTSLALVNPNGYVPAGNSNVVSFAELKNVNPDLKWEVSRTFNIGLEAQMLGSRLLFSLNYYRTKVTDMLYPYAVSTPPFTYNTLVDNLGSMRNKGLEISVGGTPLIRRDMELTINANVTFQQNKLLSLSGDYNGETLEAPTFHSVAKMNGAGFHGGSNDVTYQAIGYALGTFYMPHCTGLETNSNGEKYYATDGQGSYVAGQAMPKMLLGSNFSFRYKRLDISLQANGAFGHKIYNGTSLTYMDISSFPLYNILAEAPAQNINDRSVTDYWLENGNYVNIDYVTLGYRVPLRKNKYVESLRLSFTMDNVATFTNYSGLTPMINSSSMSKTLGLDDKISYPLYHTYTFSVNLSL